MSTPTTSNPLTEFGLKFMLRQVFPELTDEIDSRVVLVQHGIPYYLYSVPESNMYVVSYVSVNDKTQIVSVLCVPHDQGIMYLHFRALQPASIIDWDAVYRFVMEHIEYWEDGAEHGR